MKLSKQQLSDIIYTPVIRDELDRLASEARAELEAGTLEIEGYVRADHFDDAEEKVWTRYIPNKPHTHPEPGEFVLTCMKGDMEVVEFKAGAGFYFHSETFGRTFVNDPYFPLFWRHLPKPPKEFNGSPSWRSVPKPPVETEETK